MTSPEQEAASKVLYDYMLAAHVKQFGAVSIQMRHYLMGQAEQLVDRLGMRRQLVSQSEDQPDSYHGAPVEDMWNTARRKAGVGPIRKWRELQIIYTAPLPTEKDWR